MRRELYTVRNKPVKGRISKELSDSAAWDEAGEELQKATLMGIKSMEIEEIAVH
jgi:hypothetical protein